MRVLAVYDRKQFCLRLPDLTYPLRNLPDYAGELFKAGASAYPH